MKDDSIPKEKIQGRAYALYLKRGAEDGHALEDWFEAEEELKREEQLKNLSTEGELRQATRSGSRKAAAG